jgi:CRISPR-associated protein Cmr2
MPTYLLKLSIGPVQGFIAAARRSRDLWFGSYLLSTASKSAAKSLKENGASLIFPADEEGLLDAGPGRQISNIILAQVETGKIEDVKRLVEDAKKAARDVWLKEANAVFNRVQQAARPPKKLLHELLWKQQEADVLEFQAAWVGVPCGNDGYLKGYERLDELLAARKNTRDFLRAQNTQFGIQKSSLDAARESVIANRHRLRLRVLGIGDTEELDCVGVVKRVGGKFARQRGDGNDTEHFTPLSRIALDPWVRGFDSRQRKHLKTRLDQLVDGKVLKSLLKYDLVTKVSGNLNEIGVSIYRNFPFDGQLLFENRLRLEKAGAGEVLRRQLETLEHKLAPLLADNKPNPYLAILQADGDSMGGLLRNPKSCTLQAHTEISKALTEFAHRAQSIIREHYGHAIYTGGDDVLALVPLDQAIKCADALRLDFAKSMQKVIDALGDNQGIKSPSLSVGLAIGHFLEPLPVLLDMAHRAERLAKGDGSKQPRNALGIILKPRSGGEIEMRSPWVVEPETPEDQDSEEKKRVFDTIKKTAQRMDVWVQAFYEERLPDAIAYLLREAEERLNTISHNANKNIQQDLWSGMVKRIVSRRQIAPGKDVDQAETEDSALAEKLSLTGELLCLPQLAAELLIARRIAAARALVGDDGPTQQTEVIGGQA